MMRRLILLGLFVAAVVGAFQAWALPAQAATPAASAPDSGFSLQVTPSPLVTTVKPGQTTTVDLKIRNAGTETENLKIETRSFKFDSKSGHIDLSDNPALDISNWIKFNHPTVSVDPGAWATESITFSLPKESGFSYSFALVISRTKNPQPTQGGRLIKGSVAVFTLVNVDRPGATRKLDVGNFSASKHFYEYLPATLSIRFKNTGNSIVQPYGNVFIQRKSDSKTPLASLAVNDKKGYILPGTERTLSTSWSNGFPVYQTTANEDGSTKQHLVWDWSKSKFSNVRIGRYTAKLVAVYNDGQRDVPIEGEITFWVFPWKAFSLLIVAIVGLWFLQHWRMKRKTEKAVQKALAAAKKSGTQK